MQQIPDSFEVACSNPVFRTVASEELVRSDKPVAAMWQRIADFRTQRLCIIIRKMPGSHHFKNTAIRLFVPLAEAIGEAGD